MHVSMVSDFFLKTQIFKSAGWNSSRKNYSDTDYEYCCFIKVSIDYFLISTFTY